jgi:L-fuconolactonase
MTTVIDAHQHFWELRQPFDYAWLDGPQMAPIRRDFLPQHLAPLIEAAGVDRTVFVQTQHNLDESRWILGLAARHEFIAGVVGWVDLSSPTCEEQLAEFMSHSKFVGIRHVTQDEPDDDFIVRPDVVRGLKVLERQSVPFDLLFYIKHLKHAGTLAKALPDLPMVIDHLAKPRIKDHAMHDWVDNLRQAANYPNLYCKLSGMITEGDWKRWKAADLKPYVDVAMEAFGPERCMFGSDWPVCELAGNYGQVHAALVEALGPLSDTERGRIFGGTAIEFYGLNSSSR